MSSTPWLFTTTFYGRWLPGDRRGSVTSVRDRRPGDPASTSRFEHDRPGTPYDGAMRGLEYAAANRMKGLPIRFQHEQARVLLAQWIETARHRGRSLLAVAILNDHVHWIVAIPDDIAPERALADFKAYGSRALNQAFGVPRGGRWWTTKGSCRPLADPRRFAAAVRYVLEKQSNPLVVWRPEA